MLRRFFPVLLGVCLLGQGCLPPLTAPSNPIPQGEPSPEGLVSFKEGFGKLPGPAPIQAEVGKRPSVVLGAQLPDLPTSVAVLREWAAPPDETLLRNLTTALRIPAGVLGSNPTGNNVSVQWRDGSGFTWTYGATQDGMIFERDGTSGFTAAHTLNPNAIQTARAFLIDRGVDMTGWGEPYADGGVIFFPASRDASPVVGANGRLLPAATVKVDVSGTAVLGGTIELPPPGIDRSNYPGLTIGEALTRLRAGGTAPITVSSPTATVTYDHFSLAHYRHVAIVNGRARIFNIPALWARGTLRDGDKIAEVATTVPLVLNTAFTP